MSDISIILSNVPSREGAFLEYPGISNIQFMQEYMRRFKEITEIIQIIGRATRDSSNKTHAQFTNLIAQPDAADDLY